MFCLGEFLETTHSFFKRQWKISKTADYEVLLCTKGFVTCINGNRITLNYRHVFDAADLCRFGDSENI